MRNKIGIIIFIIIGLCSCGKQTAFNKALNIAGANREELQKVINHYQNEDNKDSLKLKAAYFLIENMIGHGSIWSTAIDTFRHRVYSADSIIEMKQINKWWTALETQNKPIIKWDLEHLNANFLIENIDKAFEAWYTAPWRNEVDFSIFCRYILPYRFEKELLADGWRDSLYKVYHPLVKDARTVKEAFEIVHDSVWKRLLSSSSRFPFVIDVVAMQNQRKAMCMQRCIMLGSVMRSLAIPAAIDNIGYWANYSYNSHAWASLITQEGTYSIFEEEFEAKINNKIDATEFDIDYPIARDYPLATNFKKRYAKIWRSTFEPYEHSVSLDSEWEAVQKLTLPFVVDVSHEYGLNGEVEIEVKVPVEYAYLCTYLTGKDWTPVCYAKVEKGRAHFCSLGDSVVYLPMGVVNDKVIALEKPFILANNQKIVLEVNHSLTKTIEINRKYPLTGKWMNEWAPMVGGLFEGSNDADFSKTDILHQINSMPVFRNTVTLNTSQKYRYIRYVSEAACDTPMAEIKLIGEDGKIIMQPAKSSVKNVELSIDNNTFTRPDIEVGYSLGYDLGTAQRIVSITYFPWNDDNFIIPEHEYELFYYDNEWKSLGKQKSDDFVLIYKDVPDKALLLLKDYTKGKEERPFVYELGKQVWW